MVCWDRIMETNLQITDTRAEWCCLFGFGCTTFEKNHVGAWIDTHTRTKQLCHYHRSFTTTTHGQSCMYVLWYPHQLLVHAFCLKGVGLRPLWPACFRWYCDVGRVNFDSHIILWWRAIIILRGGHFTLGKIVQIYTKMTINQSIVVYSSYSDP